MKRMGGRDSGIRVCVFQDTGRRDVKEEEKVTGSAFQAGW